VRALYLAVLPVFAAIFLMLAGNGLLTTLVPLRSALEGFSQAEIGTIGSSYFLSMLVGTWAAPWIVMRSGHVRAFSAYAALAAVASLGFAIAVHPVLWAFFRGVIGFCFAGLYAIVESWLNVKASTVNRGRMLAVYNIVHFSGSATGQQVLRFADPKSFSLFSGAAAFLMMSLVPMAMTRAEAPPLPSRARLDVRGMLRATPIGAVGMVLVGLANGTFWSLVPAYVEALKVGPAAVASFMTAVIIGSAAAPYPLGRLSDLGDRRIVIAGVACAAVCVEVIFALWGNPPIPMLYVLGFGLGAFTPVIYPLVTAHTVDRMGSEKAVEISSTLLFLYCVGAMVGPLLASTLMTQFGPTMLFWHNAAVHGTLALFVAWRMLRRAAAQRAEPLAEPAAGELPLS
jgi:MFS family permease